MYHRERRKMRYFVFIILALIHPVLSKSIEKNENPTNKPADDDFENNIIDFDEDYSVKFNKKYGAVPWHSNDGYEKESHRYTIVKDNENKKNYQLSLSKNETETKTTTEEQVEDTTITDYSVIPIELISTTENILISILESTTDSDLSVIPLSTTHKSPTIEINQTVVLPTSTQTSENTEEYSTTEDTTTIFNENETTTSKREASSNDTVTEITVTENKTSKANTFENEQKNKTKSTKTTTEPNKPESTTTEELNKEIIQEVLNTNSTKQIETRADTSTEQEDVPIFTELDTEEEVEVPEDYYDSKDVVPTTAPKTDAISVIFGLAGSVVESVVESVAERVVPKGIFDLFKRMQKQNEALEAERLRSREENGGLGQFTRGILKTISTGISKPFSQLMAGVRDIGSLDTDRGFVGSVASGVTSVANVANSVVDSFKDRVQAIYPGTVWCGDGHSATARSSDLGLFFFTDTCCRQHDACKIYIKAGETKYGLTNTGLFTRSHCSCDVKFRECLRRTNSLVSAQIGLTYFNVLGPQCFRKAHPIVRCLRKTRITGQKCEEYELDYTKPKMWQWFDNETF